MHERGIVHRDLKPENVLLTAHGAQRDFVKVVDFGISTFVEGSRESGAGEGLTPTGRTMGTPHHASPEQIRGGGGRDARVDIYATGVLLYEMLAGHHPFDADDVAELCHLIVSTEPPPFAVFRRDVPEALEAVVRRALAKRPEDRFETTGAMLEALVPFGAPAPEPEGRVDDTLDNDLRELRAREERVRDAGRERDERSSGARAVHGVRGEVLTLVSAFLRERIGDQGLESCLEPMKPATRALLEEDVVPDMWVPARPLAVMEIADTRFGTGDRRLFADLGRYVARQHAEGLVCSTPELFFASAPDLWTYYFSVGTARALEVGRGYGRLEVREHPVPLLGRAVAVVGFLDEGLRLAGARDADVRLTRAAALGDETDVFEATWGA